MQNLLSKKKIKCVDDLIRFIENKYESHPNYSLLLGSGCSCSSNIRTAGELINAWKHEIFIQHEQTQNLQECIPPEYFNQFDWYQSQNEYSCLFEALYDLPIQRKEFIEKEIFGKTPSLGYAYLVKLIEEGKFSTLFTTNFDDLINEAFYTYGGIENRPIVCAHDSSIKSITPLSKRPKIIKLHGDYLFDNFKTSQQDTTSLEDNMKGKVEEFARITGLIVVGYAGHDDSVMDALIALMKDESYYQQGIYWCLRRQDKISDKVQELLYLDRCYLVYIDGFDELMCQISLRLKVKSPIELITHDTSTRLIKDIIENPFLQNTQSQILKGQLQELSIKYKRLSKQDEDDKDLKGDIDSDDVYSFVEQQDSSMSVNERTIISRLQKKIDLEEYESVSDEIEALLLKQNDRQFIEKLRTILGELYFKQEHFEKARRIVEILINDDPYQVNNYLNLLACTQRYPEKLKIVKNAIVNCPYDSTLYVTKAQILRRIDIESNGGVFLDVNTEINEVLHEGEKYSSYVDSECWQYYFDYNYHFTKPGDAPPSECLEIFNKYNEVFPRHLEVIRRKLDLFKLDKTSFTVITKYIDDHRFSDKNENLAFDLLRLEYVFDQHDIQKTRELINQFDFFYDDKQQYILLKAEIEYDFFRNITKATQTLHEYLKNNPEKKNLQVKKALINQLLHQGKFNLAMEIIETSDKKSQLKKLFRIKLLESQEKWQEVVEETEKSEQVEGETVSSLSAKSHALLMLDRFEEVKTLLHPSIEKNQQPNSVLIINCELADSKIREKKTRTSKKRQRIELIAKSEKCDKAERAAAFILLDEIEKAKVLILEDLRDEFSSEHTYSNCYVFVKYKGDIVSELIESVRKEPLD